VTLEELAQQFWEASEKKQGCKVLLTEEPMPRTVCPYGICKTAKNQIVVVCWQISGFTKGGHEGYRNLQLTKIAEIEILTWHFQKRGDFNPMDGQYKEWVYHI
jgi:hypothetical protein